MNTIMRRIAMAAILGALMAKSQAGLADDQAIVAEKLLKYCRACHGLGTLRFLPSTETEHIWATLTTEYVPNTTILWKDAIIGALSWPTAMPPAAGSMRVPGKEWMPKGIKRLELAADSIEAESARLFILRALKGAE